MLIHFLFGLWFFSVAAGAAPTQTLSSRAVLNSAGVTSHKLDQLDQGEIISQNIQEATNKEVAMSVAIYLAVPLEKVVDYLRSVHLFAIDSNVAVYGSIPRNASPGDFKGFAFSSNQIDEAIDLLNSEAGDSFNLSSQEISSFSALQPSLANADKNTLSIRVSQKYREILQQRWQTYKHSGLKGIAAYARNDGGVNPAAEFNASADNCKVLTRYFPELFHAWMHYPASLPPGAEEHFYWINRLVENRPTAILAHSVLQLTDFGVLIVGRQFYVGHSYNSSHMCAGVLPYRDGSLIYYVESSSTDQVAGIASDLRHAIGRAQLQEQMVEHLEKLSKSFEAGGRAN